ncbi:TIGR03546 family protein [Aestuariibacter halophilus]|uniref:TIGR03546 family protein n=1 Tax=Fluctibacter halophilus TaxID=226011 RepID=A0ABS8GCZ6_9ALTE|nr:TIGR03546 family protein [Aestuariibacter halophilus]MCC2617976.1 TIGR03546 family protein [Aestuariibacter halophilus]
MALLARLLKALHSANSPWQLALGFALGMLLGLTPLWRPHNLLVLLVVLATRVNLSMFLLGWALFSLLAVGLDPVSVALGEGLLAAPALQGLWEALYATGIGRLSQFNHTLTLGSLVLGLVLFLPIAVISKVFIVRYRQHMQRWADRFFLVQWLKTSRAFKLFQTMRGES